MKKAEIIEAAIENLNTENVSISKTQSGETVLHLENRQGGAFKNIKIVVNKNNELMNICELNAMRIFLNEILGDLNELE